MISSKIMKHRQVALHLSFCTYVLIILTLATGDTTSNTTTPTTTITKGATITKPGCPKQCGNLTVPYPFGIGIGSGCALDPGFEIDCNTSTGSPKPLIGNINVYEISDAEMRISSTVARRCYTREGLLQLPDDPAWMTLGTTPYSFSALNKFFVVGCDEAAVMFGLNYANGCFSLCTSSSDIIFERRCMGIGCGQIEIPKGLKYFNASILSMDNHTQVWSFNRCGYAFLGESSRFQFRGVEDHTDDDVKFIQRIFNNVPIVLDWAIGSLTCVEAQNRTDYACLENSQCVDSNTSLGGYRCSCNSGYEGNPYISPGCQDIDECVDSNANLCEHNCINTPGSYNCSCHEGYSGDGKKDGHGCIALNSNSEFPWIKFSVE